MFHPVPNELLIIKINKLGRTHLTYLELYTSTFIDFLKLLCKRKDLETNLLEIVAQQIQHLLFN